MTSQTLLFALLRCAICGAEPGEEIKAACTEERLQPIYDLARRHDLAHLVGHALSTLELPDSEGLKEFQQAAAMAVFRHARLDNELRQIEHVLQAAGIAFVPLKGAVIRDLYPMPWMRTSGDLDVLVHEADLERAAASLTQQLSYKTDGVRNYHDLLLVSPSGIHVELHFSIQENTASIDALLERVWDYARPTEGCRYALSNEFLAFHLLAHMSYHFVHGGCGIRPLMDVFLLRRQAGLDEAVLRGYLSRCGIERFYDHVLALIGVWFEDGSHTTVTQDMAEFILTGGTYGSRRQRLAVDQERRGGRFRYLLSRVFMPYGNMRRKYPVLQTCPILLPLMHVRRWGTLLFGGKLRRALAEFRRTGELKKEQIKDIGCLLRQLGL